MWDSPGQESPCTDYTWQCACATGPPKAKPIYNRLSFCAHWVGVLREQTPTQFMNGIVGSLEGLEGFSSGPYPRSPSRSSVGALGGFSKATISH